MRVKVSDLDVAEAYMQNNFIGVILCLSLYPYDIYDICIRATNLAIKTQPKLQNGEFYLRCVVMA